LQPGVDVLQGGELVLIIALEGLPREIAL